MDAHVELRHFLLPERGFWFDLQKFGLGWQGWMELWVLWNERPVALVQPFQGFVHRWAVTGRVVEGEAGPRVKVAGLDLG